MLIGFSRALYSSWFFYKPFRALFDCGEGCALNMRNYSFGVERIFLSHSHGDHIYGLPAFLDTRGSARGDKNKPLTIYYPEENKRILDLKKFCDFSKRSFEINWVGIKPDFQVKIAKNIFIESFEMDHSRSFKTLGYRIIEVRSRLKLKYKDKNIAEMLNSGVERSEICEEYFGVLFAYCLDSYKFDVEKVRNAQIAVLDCTFLESKDRKAHTHMTYNECMELAAFANIKMPLLGHISGRYSEKEISYFKKRPSSNLIENNKLFRLTF